MSAAAELTLPQAADALNASQRFVAGLLQAGEIEHQGEDGDLRISASSLLAYRRRDDAERRRAADELLVADQEAGMPQGR
ncbi:helix-turn-helix domain-containing protein [Streptomyces sp. NPDC059740]|uniref:helix-turn-helix domain-containing protein n=1 Tax=Streptomyces sp. NPDC059740 TaxID=3346926 RepID=UPI00365912FE